MKPVGMTVLLLSLLAATPVSSDTGTAPMAHCPSVSADLLIGPDEVDPGKSAIVKASLADGGAEYDWKVEPRGTSWISGENKSETFVILLDLEPGQYVVSFVSFDKKVHETHEISVEDPSPTPPTPTPTPDPVLPDGKFGLAKLSLGWVADTVPGTSRASAKSLAGSFRSLASAIAAGTVTLPADILAQTRSSNNSALAADMNNWKAWGQKLSDQLSSLSSSGSLRTADDYKTAWEEIATGLEEVK